MTLAKFLLESPLQRNLRVTSPNLVELLNSQANGLSQKTEGVFMRKFIVSSLVLCLLSLTALAQTSNTGSLVGTVSGPDGVIPGATVTITDSQTQRERATVTNGEGGFTFSQLEFGSYTVTIKAPGFKTHTATNLKIDAGREYSLTPTLEIGEITESVTV